MQQLPLRGNANSLIYTHIIGVVACSQVPLDEHEIELALREGQARYLRHLGNIKFRLATLVNIGKLTVDNTNPKLPRYSPV
jgi:hypothetical protein